jgi:methylaspartate mutase epsilon subunit
VEPHRAWALIAFGAAVGRLAGVDKIVVKTPEEALGVPGIDSNVAAVSAVRYALDLLPEISSLSSELVERERELIGAEVDTVLDHILEPRMLAGRSLLSAVHRAVRTGVIDVPFAPHCHNAGRVVADRGRGLAIRVVDPGGVPLTPAQLRQEDRLRGTGGPGPGPLWERLLRDARVLTGDLPVRSGG